MPRKGGCRKGYGIRKVKMADGRKHNACVKIKKHRR